MKIFHELNKLGYKHYTQYTVEQLDNLSLDSEERLIEQSLVIKWFRNNYNLFIQPNNRIIDNQGIWYYFLIATERTDVCEGSFSYEEAELQCLRKLIEIAKNLHNT